MNIKISNRVGGGSDPTTIETWNFTVNNNVIEIMEFQAIYSITANGVNRGRFHIGHGNLDSAEEERQLNLVLECLGAPTFQELSNQIHVQEEAEHECRWY